MDLVDGAALNGTIFLLHAVRNAALENLSGRRSPRYSKTENCRIASLNRVAYTEMTATCEVPLFDGSRIGLCVKARLQTEVALA
jgi:hypothetical protein